MPPETRYAQGPEGQIAYQVVGEGPRDLVYLSGTTSHVDVRWESPYTRRFLDRLASFSRLIMFDRRGVGASDPVPIDRLPTWEEWADDLRVVMDAAGSREAAIFGLADAAPLALMFAASTPERTTALVLCNSTARWLAADDYPQGMSSEASANVVDLIERGWGNEEFAVMGQPSIAEDPKERAWFAKYMRAGASPRMAAAQMRLAASLDLRQVLSTIRVPTLILHRREHSFIPLEQGRYLADHIKGAKFVELDGSDTSPAYGDDSTPELVEEFLTGVRSERDPDRVLATVLFTDLVDSTSRASELGDRKWSELLSRHDEVMRNHIESDRGRVWKTTGDGVLATFDAPGRAIRCAFRLREAVGELGLSLRAGLHSGEMELRGDDVTGIAVNLASRVSGLAAAGEVLVSRTVTDLVAGSDIRFADRGVHSLKGVPGEWQIYLAQG